MVTISETEVQMRLRDAFSRTWPLIFGEGILSVVIGLLLMTSPVRTVLFLVQVLGVYWFLAGLARMVTSVMARASNPSWGWRLAGGAVYTLLGAAILARPLYVTAVTGLVLVYTIGALAVIGGILSTAWGIKMMSYFNGEWLSIVGGLMSILFGILLFAAPFFASAALLVFAGIFAVIGGIGEIVLSLRLHNLGKTRNRLESRQYAAK